MTQIYNDLCLKASYKIDPDVHWRNKRSYVQKLKNQGFVLSGFSDVGNTDFPRVFFMSEKTLINRSLPNILLELHQDQKFTIHCLHTGVNMAERLHSHTLFTGTYTDPHGLYWLSKHRLPLSLAITYHRQLEGLLEQELQAGDSYARSP